MAFTSVDHGCEAESDPEMKGDLDFCAVGRHDLIKVR